MEFSTHRFVMKGSEIVSDAAPTLVPKRVT
jgi:hypothetical protein